MHFNCLISCKDFSHDFLFSIVVFFSLVFYVLERILLLFYFSLLLNLFHFNYFILYDFSIEFFGLNNCIFSLVFYVL